MQDTVYIVYEVCERLCNVTADKDDVYVYIQNSIKKCEDTFDEGPVIIVQSKS